MLPIPIGAAGGGAAGECAMADIFTAALSGEREAPTPVATAASGIGGIVWDEDTQTAAYTVRVAGVDFGPTLGMAPQTADPGDDVTGMHVHNAARGVRGPVVFGQIGEEHDNDDLSIVPNADGSWTVRGIWEPTDPANVPITDFADALTPAPAGEVLAAFDRVIAEFVADDTIPAPAGEALAVFGRAVAEFADNFALG